MLFEFKGEIGSSQKKELMAQLMSKLLIYLVQGYKTIKVLSLRPPFQCNKSRKSNYEASFDVARDR